MEEPSDIGTADLRIDSLSAEAQPEIKDVFRRYVEARLAIYEHVYDLELARSYFAQSGPDRMYLNANSIVFVEPVGIGSKAAQLIAEASQQE